MDRGATLRHALDIAFEAGRSTLSHFRTRLTADWKADDSPVTIADRHAEELIRSRLERTFPEDGVLGEEFGETRAGAPRRWIVDPIDGTKSFMRGVPLYAVLLALEVEGVVEVGVAYFPALDEMVYAALGQGAFLNGRAIRVADTADLARAFVAFTDAGAFDEHGRADAWRRVRAATYHRVGWGDAYGHALVASGRIELMLDPVLNAWDGGPFAIILPEAGGYFGDWRGRSTLYGGEGMSTSAALLPEVLRVLRGTAATDRGTG